MDCTGPCRKPSARIHVLCLVFGAGVLPVPSFPPDVARVRPKSPDPKFEAGQLPGGAVSTAPGWEDLGFASGYAAPRGATWKNPITPPQAAEDGEGLSVKPLRANRVVAVVSLREQRKERRHHELPRVRLWEHFSNSSIS